MTTRTLTAVALCLMVWCMLAGAMFGYWLRGPGPLCQDDGIEAYEGLAKDLQTRQMPQGV